MVEIDKILSERSDERILSALKSISDSEFTAAAERILGFLGLKITRSRARGDSITRAPITAGTLQPKPRKRGRKDLPCSPIRCMKRSIT